MNRARAAALLALGCGLAAAAAGTGPYLSARPVEDQPIRELIRQAAEERQRRRLRLPAATVPDSWIATGLDALLVAVFVVALAFGLVRIVLLLKALARLRLLGGGRGVHPPEYDAGEESHQDAVTALRKRVADELTALSADLDTVADAREVVIACYARMEGALAGAGSARRPDETPWELLARVLSEQYVPEEDIRRLTALFAEARFSTHPVTDDMRDAARRALRNISSALTAAV